MGVGTRAVDTGVGIITADTEDCRGVCEYRLCIDPRCAWPSSANDARECDREESQPGEVSDVWGFIRMLNSPGSVRLAWPSCKNVSGVVEMEESASGLRVEIERRRSGLGARLFRRLTSRLSGRLNDSDRECECGLGLVRGGGVTVLERERRSSELTHSSGVLVPD